MAHSQGAVVVGTDPFGGNQTRPYLVLSNSTHPFHGEEYLAALVTTTERNTAVPLAGEYVEGRLPYESYVNPWNLLTLKNTAVEKRVAQASDTVVATTVDELTGCVVLEPETT